MVWPKIYLVHVALDHSIFLIANEELVVKVNTMPYTFRKIIVGTEEQIPVSTNCRNNIQNVIFS